MAACFMKKGHEGTCALCGERTTLQESHLIPKAVYKFLRDESGREIIVRKDKDQRDQLSFPPGGGQLKEYLLCRACEEHFSRYEKYVISRMSESAHDNPLLAVLEESTKKYMANLNGNCYYFIFENDDTIQIDWHSYFQFALSVFWRCSVSKLNQTIKYHGALGPYSEKIRSLLLGMKALPEDNLFLTVSVDNTNDQCFFLSFPTVYKAGGYHVHTLIMPHLVFRLYVGKMLPPMFAHLVLKNMHIAFFVGDITKEKYMGKAISMVQRATPCGKAIQFFQ